MPFPLRAVALVMPQLASVAHLALAAGVCRAWRSVIGSEAEVSGRIHSALLNRRPCARIGATHTAHCRLVSIGHASRAPELGRRIQRTAYRGSPVSIRAARR